MNRKYEAFFIIRPTAKDAELGTLIERFKKVVTDQGGQVAKAEVWERRKLAYEIKGHKDGIYVIMNFEAGANAPAELDRILRISDDVIRHTITKDLGHEANVIAEPAAIPA